MRSILLIFAITLLSLTRLLAAAYWLEIIGSGKVNELVRLNLYYGSMDEFGTRQPDTGKEFNLTGKFRLTVIDAHGKQVPLTLKPMADHWQASFTPEYKGCYRIIGIHNQHPVLDRSSSGGENVLPIDYIATWYKVETEEDSHATPLQTFDMTAFKQGKLISVKVFNHNLPAPKGEKLRVFNPDNWEKELTLDTNGEAKFYPTMKGLYIIRQDSYENKAGKSNGTLFSRVRHRCNFYLFLN